MKKPLWVTGIAFWLDDFGCALWALMPSPREAWKVWKRKRSASASVIATAKAYRASADRGGASG